MGKNKAEEGVSSEERTLLNSSILIGLIPHANINYRLKSKLKYEQKQLPASLPNIIVIRDYLFFNFYRNEIKVIGKYLKYKNVAMFILIDGYSSNDINKEIREGRHLYSLIREGSC
jgi:hypothetical protein